MRSTHGSPICPRPPAGLLRGRRPAGLAAAALLLVAVLALFTRVEARGPASEPAGSPAGPAALLDRQRIGFVVLSGLWPQHYDVAQLGAGWFSDFTLPLCRESPGGMDRVLGVKTNKMIVPPTLGAVVDNHPGTLWLIGNEPDCVYQDDLRPEQYAQIYHELYTFIKGRDPTARVAAGGIVQATPVRLAWLDAVLVAYHDAYSATLPADAWHIHNQILNERPGQWGCDVPPGISPALALTRTIEQNADLGLFQQQILDLRQWLADRGYGGSPLLVSEFGVLMPAEYGFPPEVVNAFMSDSFAWLAAATDELLGDPDDGGRLVQRWAWYSLDDQPYDPDTQLGFNGNLFDPETRQITAFGRHYAGLTAGLASLQYVDLLPGQRRVEPVPALPGPSGTVTLTLHAQVENPGTLPAGPFSLALQFGGPVAGQAEQSVPGLGAGAAAWVSFTFPGLPVGSYSLSGQVDATGQVAESTECNNSFTGQMVAPAARSTLALVPRLAHPAAGGNAAPAVARGAVPPAARTEPAADARFREWPLPDAGSYPAQIAVDPDDGTIWFTEWLSNRIGHLDPATDVLVEYEITPTLDSRPWGLALDAQGGVWFAETAADQIGRLDPASGLVVEYPLPTPDAEPWDVAVAGNGIVWFTERAANQIGRLDPATGTVTEYALPTAGALPAGLVVQHGTDTLTYVWFAESGAGRLGRLKWQNGAFQGILEPQIPTPGSAPQDVALNFAGFVWLSEAGANKLALFRVTTIGDFTEFAVPQPASEPYGIAIDRDGQSVWFTERAANRIGWFGGLFLEYVLPQPDSLPTGVAVDESGCAWYTAPGSGRVGRFCPAGAQFYVPLIFRGHASARGR